MKYNPDLAHKILLYLEANDLSEMNGEVLVEGHSEEEISYHIKILHQQGLVEGLDASGFGKSHWQAKDLTPAGHINLQKSRDKRQVNTNPSSDNQADPRKVFVVHGRNEALRRSIFDFLRSIDLEPIEWAEAIRLTGKAAPYVGDILDTAFSVAQAIVVLMTPDDEARLLNLYRGNKEPIYETELTKQPRQNVLIEAGMALGRHPNRTVLIEIGSLRPISDIVGRHTVRLDNSIGRRQDIVDRLETAECAVNIKGKRDWHTVGNFESTQVSQTEPDMAMDERNKKEIAELEKKFAVLSKTKEICDREGENSANFLAKTFASTTSLIHLISIAVLIYLNFFASGDGWSIYEKLTFAIFAGLEILNLLFTSVLFFKTTTEFSWSAFREGLSNIRSRQKYRVNNFSSYEFEKIKKELEKRKYWVERL